MFLCFYLALVMNFIPLRRFLEGYTCVYIYIYVHYICKQYTQIHERQASCVFLLRKKLEVKEVIPDDLNESSNFITQNHMILSF